MSNQTKTHVHTHYSISSAVGVLRLDYWCTVGKSSRWLEMRVAIAKCRGIGEFFGISMAYLCKSFVLSGTDFIFGMVIVKDNRLQPHTSLLW